MYFKRSFILILTACATALDVVFLVDNSGSINRENFEVIRHFIKEIIDQLDLDNGNVSYVKFKFKFKSFYSLKFHKYKLTIDYNKNIRNVVM